MARRNVIVIGSSQGGLDPLRQLINGLPSDLKASLFIVRHIATTDDNYLTKILHKDSSLPVKSAEHNVPFAEGTIYVAPADTHLLIDAKNMILSRGPRENLCRPAIDPLFRSAAACFGPRVVGIILSGELDDGTSGLIAIKKGGGIAIVQDPETAASPSMPRSALENANIDHCLPADEIGELIGKLVTEEVTAHEQKVENQHDELEIVTGTDESIEIMESDGSLHPIGCPDCGGPLWQLNERSHTRYRCHTGHSYTSRSLVHGLQENEEQALYVALRTLEEKVRLLKNLEKQSSGAHFLSRREEAERQSDILRKMLHSTGYTEWKCGE